jgi:chemotaxis protein histidine kinase CheA
MFDIMPADIESSDEKPSLSRRLINKTLQHAQDAVEFASDTSRNIAGVADALGSNRIYKEAWALERILELFKEQSGKHFDPTLVDIFLNNLDEFLEIRDKYKD